MYKLIGNDGEIYKEYSYAKEDEFERVIVENADKIFGKSAIYFDIKKKIGKSNQGAAIPDGYLLDLTSHNTPRLFFVEIELGNHDVFGHIGEQMLKFAISSESTKHKILTILLGEINKDEAKKAAINTYLKMSKFENVNALMTYLVFEQEAAVVIVIDRDDADLSKVLSKIKMPCDVYEFQTFVNGDKKIHRFVPFMDDVIETEDTIDWKVVDVDKLDTIVVPAVEDGFQKAFIQSNAWWAIRISSSMIDKIKYIAAYQTAPTSAITYLAEVDRIERYKDTNKYIVYFENSAQPLKSPVRLGDGGKGAAPQAPRYTNHNKLLKAKTLKDIWG